MSQVSRIKWISNQRSHLKPDLIYKMIEKSQILQEKNEIRIANFIIRIDERQSIINHKLIRMH